MNKLEITILDQHKRLRSVGKSGHEVLREAQAEVMGEATAERVEEVLARSQSLVNFLGSNSNNLSQVRRRLDGLSGRGLVDPKIVTPNQGHIGVLVKGSDGEAEHVFGFSADGSVRLSEADPIQKAVDTLGEGELYPAMMWAKSLYSEAYNNRSEPAQKLTIQEWLAELAGPQKLLLGSVSSGGSALLGATGFMPSAQTILKLNSRPGRENHIAAEPIPEFRASGLCDQFALECALSPKAYPNPERIVILADEVLARNGSLN